jgi:hypothetical protein
MLLLIAASFISARASYYADDRYGSTSSSSSSFDVKCIGYDDSYYDRGWPENNDLSHTCKTQSSNAHGKFTSLGTCTFRFHHILNDTVSANFMSSACLDENVIDEERNGALDDPIKQEVYGWPDACVGDFQRCYMFDRDEHIIMPHLCRNKVSVPKGTTHVSVDCTADKASQIRRANTHYAVSAAIIAAVLACVCCCLALLKRCFVQPCLDAWKSNRSDYRYTDIRSDAERVGLDWDKQGKFESDEPFASKREKCRPEIGLGAIELT